MARNEHAAELAAFTALLLEALEDPQVVKTISEKVFGHARSANSRSSSQLSISGIGQARDLKESRRQGRARG
jgi:hypothetical protein